MMSRLFFFALLFGSVLVNAQDIKKGDTILVIRNRPLNSIEPDYFREDEWMSLQNDFIVKDMPGSRFIVYKAKRGYVYIKSRARTQNEWTPMKFKIDVEQALKDSAIYIFSVKQ